MKGLLGEKQSPDDDDDADDAPAGGGSSSIRRMVRESPFSPCRPVTDPHQAPHLLVQGFIRVLDSRTCMKFLIGNLPRSAMRQTLESGSTQGG